MTEAQTESGGGVRETMGQAVDKSKETAQQGVEKAKETAQQGLEKAKESAGGALTRQLDEQSTMAGERASTLAQAARRVADELRGQGDEETAKVTEAAADRAERFAGYLRDSSGDAFLRDLESFARRRPWVAAAGGFMIGVAASRFIKASAERRGLSGDGQTNGGRYADVEAPAHGRSADVETPEAAPAQHFGHAEGAV
jgi:vacuolar-type H+-ATPase subunit H